VIVSVDFFYLLVGLLFAATAIMNLRDRANPRRVTTCLFWGLYALVYLLGERIPPLWAGVLMMAMALVGGLNLVRAGSSSVPDESTRRASATRLGQRLLIPALAIPLVT
jgi:uncharacterized membrane protein